MPEGGSSPFAHLVWRGHGIGRCLLRYALDICGATTLEVNAQNERALGFYLERGDGFGKPHPLLHMRVKSDH